MSIVKSLPCPNRGGNSLLEAGQAEWEAGGLAPVVVHHSIECSVSKLENKIKLFEQYQDNFTANSIIFVYS